MKYTKISDMPDNEKAIAMVIHNLSVTNKQVPESIDEIRKMFRTMSETLSDTKTLTMEYGMWSLLCMLAYEGSSSFLDKYNQFADKYGIQRADGLFELMFEPD